MMACSKLSTSDLSRVRNEVLSAAAKWYNIGLDLGMSPDYLDTIEKANNDAQECLLKMLRQWLLAKPSWESLIAALRGPAINYSALASEIEKKYCSTTIECAERHEHPVSGHGYMVQNNHWKLELVKSFEGITSHEVSKEQLEKAKQCIEHGGTRKERYHIIEFEKLLDENQTLGTEDYPSLMVSSFDGLSKCITTLIIPKRPLKWRSINTAGTFFKNHVICMKGYEEILQSAGYTVKEGASLRFPEDVQEPDKEKLFVLAAELLIARVEVEQIKCAAVKRGNVSSAMPKQKPCEHLQKPTSSPTACNCSPCEKYANVLYNGSKFCFINPQSAQNLSCQQCKNIAYEPYQCDCCHSLFCKKCILPNQCPSCNKLSMNSPDLRSDKLIQSLLVCCPNSIAAGLGCEWKGELREVPDHRKECPLEKVSCLYSVVGCDAEKMHRKKLKEHEEISREIHLNLAMKEVVSMRAIIKNLTENVEQLKKSFQEFKEEHTIYV